MTRRCNKEVCSAYGNCTAIVEKMDIPMPVMQEIMQSMQSTANYNVITKNVTYDFELQGINLREYYRALLNISNRCKIS